MSTSMSTTYIYPMITPFYIHMNLYISIYKLVVSALMYIMICQNSNILYIS